MFRSRLQLRRVRGELLKKMKTDQRAGESEQAKRSVARASISYVLLCGGIGLVLGWLPMLVHGPIPEKWTYFSIDGHVLVWGYYLARLSIGVLVGISVVPRLWYLRGPVCGAIAMIPLGFVALGNPLCAGP